MSHFIVAAQGPLEGRLLAAFAAADGFEVETVPDIVALISRLSLTGPRTHGLVDFRLGSLREMQMAAHAAAPGSLSVLVSLHSAELARRLLASGVRGVLPDTMPGPGMVAALRLVTEGHRLAVFGPALDLGEAQAGIHLSERELQVLQGLCDGLQNKEIAHTAEVQEVTVKMHVRAIIRKLGARNRTHAAMIARDLGIC